MSSSLTLSRQLNKLAEIPRLTRNYTKSYYVVCHRYVADEKSFNLDSPKVTERERKHSQNQPKHTHTTIIQFSASSRGTHRRLLINRFPSKSVLYVYTLRQGRITYRREPSLGGKHEEKSRPTFSVISTHHEGIWGNGEIAPFILNFGTRWR